MAKKDIAADAELERVTFSNVQFRLPSEKRAREVSKIIPFSQVSGNLLIVTLRTCSQRTPQPRNRWAVMYFDLGLVFSFLMFCLAVYKYIHSR